MFIIKSKADAKDAAARIRSRLARDGVVINHAMALETISAAMGHQNWNVASATLMSGTTFSPILGIQSKNKRYIDVCFSNVTTDGVSPFTIALGSKNEPIVLEGRAGSRLHLEEKQCMDGQTYDVTDLLDAERLVLSMVDSAWAPVFDCSMVTSNQSGQDPAPNAWTAFFVMVLRQANLIAARTRQGAGNVLLVSTKVMTEYLEPALIDNPFVTTTPTVNQHTYTSNFQFHGTMNGGISIYSAPFIPDDAAYVLYKHPDATNQINAPAMYFADENKLYIPKRSMGTLSDYISVIKIKH